MSYEPYTWSNGDTITAARLNNIEQGIGSLGGRKQGPPVVAITVTNSPSWNRNLLFWYYAHKNGNTYTLASNWNSSWCTSISAGNLTHVHSGPLAIPELESLCLLVSFGSGSGTLTAKSGGISASPITINNGQYYEITGDFSITVNGT